MIGHVVAAPQHSYRRAALVRARAEPGNYWNKLLKRCAATPSNKSHSFRAIAEIMSVAAAFILSESCAGC